MSNNVQHPKHYNAHPAGIECIDVIRHYVCDIANAQKYLWRAGLKPEQGISDRDKEIEDLEKSLFYIADYRKNPQHSSRHGERDTKTMLRRVRKVTGYTAEQIVSGYPKPIADAMTLLLVVGIIRERGGNICASIRTRGALVRWGVWIALIMLIVIFGAYGAEYMPVDPMYAEF